MENPNTNCGDIKPWGLKPINLNLLYESSYTYLPNHFTLKTYYLVPIT